jgi:hypothetical protein
LAIIRPSHARKQADLVRVRRGPRVGHRETLGGGERELQQLVAREAVGVRVVEPVRVEGEQRSLQRGAHLGLRELARGALDDVRRGRGVQVAKEDRADVVAVDLGAVDLHDRGRTRAPGAEADEGAVLRVQLGVQPDRAHSARGQFRLDRCDVVVEPASDDQDGPRNVLMSTQKALGSLTGSNSVSVPTYCAAAVAGTGRRLPNSSGVATDGLLESRG